MSLRDKYTQAGQGHVYDFFDKISAEDQKLLEQQLSKLDPEEINAIAKRAGDYTESEGKIQPLPSEVTASMLDSNPQDLSKWRKIGLDAIASGKVAVLLLAGGQGTRLGSSAPKGCYNIGLPSSKSLFQLQAERIAKVAQLAAHSAQKAAVAAVPWYIMTSGPTRAPTEEFFKANNFFGLNPANVVFFEQGVLPCLTKDGKIILESSSKVAVAPDGNGGVYKALAESGVLDDLTKRGIEHVHMYCVDNSLVKVADPSFIGFAAAREAEVAVKVVRKRNANESVGLIVSKNGAPGVIEYSEISQELAEAKDDSDASLLKLRAANIVNHYYSTAFLLKTPKLAKKLPYHVANKKIPHADPTTGETVKPSSPNGIKLEQFVFDIFPQVSLAKFASLEVARHDEFSPVKNGPGAGEDCPETARDDLLNEGKRWLEAAGAKSGPIEVYPRVSYGGEGLESFKGKQVNESYLD